MIPGLDHPPSRPLLVHSGFRALKGHFASPAEAAAWLAGLSRSLVVFPTFTGSAEDGPAKPPRLNASADPCWTGAVAEAARLLLGPAARTLHPTHSCAVAGDEAGDLVEQGLSCVTPIGPGSAVREVAERDGVIFLLGCGLGSLTLIHAAEEEAAVPFVLQPQPLPMTVVDGEGKERRTEPLFIHSWETPRDFPRLAPLLESEGVLKPLLNLGWAVEAKPALNLLTDLLRKDPFSVLSTSSIRVDGSHSSS